MLGFHIIDISLKRIHQHDREYAAGQIKASISICTYLYVPMLSSFFFKILMTPRNYELYPYLYSTRKLMHEKKKTLCKGILKDLK